jgi:hypothetical protein
MHSYIEKHLCTIDFLLRTSEDTIAICILAIIDMRIYSVDGFDNAKDMCFGIHQVAFLRTISVAKEEFMFFIL